MDRLEWVIRRETFAEIVSSLTAVELYIAVCRVDGMTDRAIGLRLGVSRRLVSHIMVRAQKRIVRDLPEAAAWLEGRRINPGPGDSGL